ncbi:MAG: putative rane protein [Herbinix sp.]|jgi:predicted membrane protein|nr:putative rane protein [Herbinix sp.]
MRNKLGNILWGLFFIVIGAGFAGEAFELWDFELFFDGWWTLFIIVPCTISIVQNGFRSGALIGLIIGILLFLSCQPGIDFDLSKLIVPAILVIIGFRLILRDSFHHRRIQGEGKFNAGNTTYHSDTEHSAVFSSNTIVVDNEPFNGTNLNAIFGAIQLNLSNAIIDHDVEISASAIFGGIDIYVPRGVKVKTNNVPIFGGVSNKTVKNTDPNAPTIYLNSTCMFGGIDIK